MHTLFKQTYKVALFHLPFIIISPLIVFYCFFIYTFKIWSTLQVHIQYNKVHFFNHNGVICSVVIGNWYNMWIYRLTSCVCRECVKKWEHSPNLHQGCTAEERKSLRMSHTLPSLLQWRSSKTRLLRKRRYTHNREGGVGGESCRRRGQQGY